MGFVNVLVENWGVLVGLLLSLHAAATFVVGITDTPKDDAIVAKVYKFVEMLAGVTEKTKQPGFPKLE